MDGALTTQRPSPSIAAIVSQHAEGAAFQWRIRDAAARQPHVGLSNLWRVDRCMEAHLDGLRIAGDAGWTAVSEAVERGAGEVFAGAVVALEAWKDDRVDALTNSVQEIGLGRGLSSGLGWVDEGQARPWIDRLGSSSRALDRRIAIAAAAIRRLGTGSSLERWLADPASEVRARAARAVGELGRTDLLPLVAPITRQHEPLTAFWAAWSAVLLGEACHTAMLRKVAEAGGPLAEIAAAMVARTMPIQAANTWRDALARNAETLRQAIVVARASGDGAVVPWLLERMRDDSLARRVGEAFSSLTGIDLAYADLDCKRPDGFESGPNDDPADKNVAMDPDEDLPWPDPQRIARWWSENRGRFSPGTRYLCGRPIAEESLIEVLRSGKQRQRAAAALELALLRPGRPLFNVAAPARVQLRLLEHEYAGLHSHKKT